MKALGTDKFGSLSEVPEVINRSPSPNLIRFLEDDLNTSSAILTHLFGLVKEADKKGGVVRESALALLRDCLFLGVDPFRFMSEEFSIVRSARKIDDEQIQALVASRLIARAAKDWKESDRIRDELAAMGVTIKDNKDGTTSWEVKR